MKGEETKNLEAENSSVQNMYIRLWKEDNILCGEYAENVDIDIEAARECVELRLKFSEGRNYVCLFDMRGMKSLTAEAREYLATKGAEQIIVCALITGNPLTRTIAHIFLTINKPKVPIRLFGDREEAKQWLMKFVKKQVKQ